MIALAASYKVLHFHGIDHIGGEMQAVDALAAEIGIDPVRIRNWIADGSLSADGDIVDACAVRALIRVDALMDRIADAESTLTQLRTELNALPDRLGKPPPRYHFWLSLGAAGAAAVVAGWGVLVAMWQLDNAVASLRSQTAYSVQSDILDIYERLSNPDLNETQVQTLITVYDERLRIADMLAKSFEALDAEFWGEYSSDVCSGWSKALCQGTSSVYPFVLKKTYPSIVALCFPDNQEQDICPIN